MQTDEQSLIVQNLARTMAQFRRLGGQNKSKYGIRQSEFMLLYTLVENKDSDARGLKVSDLSTKLNITPAGVTHMINSLEEAGYIERLADPADRRVVLVRPTDKSLEIIEKMHAEHLDFLQGLVDFLGEQDSKELIRLLTTSLEYVKERRKENGNELKK